MKTLAILTVVFVLVAVAMNFGPKENQYQGFSQLVSKTLNYVSGNKSKRAHDLDLAKYRPSFNPNK